MEAGARQRDSDGAYGSARERMCIWRMTQDRDRQGGDDKLEMRGDLVCQDWEDVALHGACVPLARPVCHSSVSIQRQLTGSG